MGIIKNKKNIKKNNYFSNDYVIFKKVFDKKTISKIKKIYFKYCLKYETKFSNQIYASDSEKIFSYLFDYYKNIKSLNYKEKKFIKNLYLNLESILNVVNERYNFKVSGINSKIVMNEMNKNTNIKFHKDLSAGDFSIIKLVGILCLTKELNYEGGEFNILNSPYNDKNFEDINCYTFKYKLDIGDIIIFPSYIMHGVSEVINGTRHTLVFSLEGDAFI